jgi:hypothetical protein
MQPSTVEEALHACGFHSSLHLALIDRGFPLSSDSLLPDHVVSIMSDAAKHPMKHQPQGGYCHSQRLDLSLPKKQ